MRYRLMTPEGFRVMKPLSLQPCSLRTTSSRLAPVMETTRSMSTVLVAALPVDADFSPFASVLVSNFVAASKLAEDL